MVEFSNPDQTEAVAIHEAPRAVHGEIIGSKRRVLGEDGNDGHTPGEVPPAGRAPTLHGRDGARSEKLQGPIGLIGVGVGTDHARTRRNAGDSVENAAPVRRSWLAERAGVPANRPGSSGDAPVYDET